MSPQIASAPPTARALGRTPIARAWAARAAVAVLCFAGASGAVAQTAIDVPAQSFDHGQAVSKPVIKWRPDASDWDRASAGPSLRVNVPVGAGARAPVIVRLRQVDEQAADAADDADAAADLDDDFVRGAQDQDDGFYRNARAR